MKPMFTVHVGEFLVGDHINRRLGRKYEAWVPTKDEGVDLLVTRRRGRHKPVKLQVKFSRSFYPESVPPDQLVAWGWFTLKPVKIRTSRADLWVFVILTARHEPHFVIIPTRELKKRMRGDKGKIWHLYLCALRKGRCFNTRGLTKAERQILYATGKTKKKRDYSPYFGNWKLLHRASK